MKKILKKYRRLSKYTKAAIWFFLCSFLQKGISTLTTPIFTRLLTEGEFGQYNVFNSWLSIITIFVTLRLYHGSYTQGLVKYEDDRKRYVSAIQGLNLILCFIWTIIYLLFHVFWNSITKLTTVQMLCMMVMIWATAVFNFWAAEQRVSLKYKQLVVLTITVSIAKPIIGIVFVNLSTDKVTARILGLALVELIGYSWLFLIQIKNGKKFFDKFYWKRAILLNTPLILHYLSQTVLSSADRIMIADIVSNDKAGIYGLAYQISQVMTLFSNTLTVTITPWVYKKIKEKRYREIEGISYICLIIVAVVNILLILIAPEVVSFFAPPTYMEAIWIVVPVAISTYFLFCYDLFVKFEFYFEKIYYIMAASISGAVINVITNYIFINVFGYYAAAYTTLLCYIIYAITHYFAMRVICTKYMNNVSIYNGKIILVISVGFTVLGMTLMFTYYSFVIRYLLLIIFIFLGVVFRKKIRKIIEQLINIRKDISEH